MKLKSNVEHYSKQFPTTFVSAYKNVIVDDNGVAYTDFLTGSGSMLYGHNPDHIKNDIFEYLNNNGVMQSLDMDTVARTNFKNTFYEHILKPRGMTDYLMQFTSPCGTDCVEAAIKLCMKKTGRTLAVAFRGSYHGQTMLARNLTDVKNAEFYDAPTVKLDYGAYIALDTLKILKPACVIIETIQASNGIARVDEMWLLLLAEVCDEIGTKLIIDDIQVGSGRTGTFFSFEDSGIKPDIILLSKAIGGGYPLAVMLLQRDMDIWSDGEHTGTFRGNNLAFIAGTSIINEYWKDKTFLDIIDLKSILEKELLLQYNTNAHGLIGAVYFKNNCQHIPKLLFDHGYIAEVVGKNKSVLKLLPSVYVKEQDVINLCKILRDNCDVTR